MGALRRGPVVARYQSAAHTLGPTACCRVAAHCAPSLAIWLPLVQMWDDPVSFLRMRADPTRRRGDHQQRLSTYPGNDRHLGAPMGTLVGGICHPKPCLEGKARFERGLSWPWLLLFSPALISLAVVLGS